MPQRLAGMAVAASCRWFATGHGPAPFRCRPAREIPCGGGDRGSASAHPGESARAVRRARNPSLTLALSVFPEGGCFVPCELPGSRPPGSGEQTASSPTLSLCPFAIRAAVSVRLPPRARPAAAGSGRAIPGSPGSTVPRRSGTPWLWHRSDGSPASGSRTRLRARSRPA